MGELVAEPVASEFDTPVDKAGALNDWQATLPINKNTATAALKVVTIHWTPHS
jgi:hypothetical protein